MMFTGYFAGRGYTNVGLRQCSEFGDRCAAVSLGPAARTWNARLLSGLVWAVAEEGIHKTIILEELFHDINLSTINFKHL